MAAQSLGTLAILLVASALAALPRLDVRTQHTKRGRAYEVRVSVVTAPDSNDRQLAVWIEGEPKSVASRIQTDGKAEYVLEFRDMPTGRYVVTVQLSNHLGQVAAQESRPLLLGVGVE